MSNLNFSGFRSASYTRGMDSSLVYILNRFKYDYYEDEVPVPAISSTLLVSLVTVPKIPFNVNK